MCGDNPPPEETDWITLLPVFHPQRFSSFAFSITLLTG